MLNCGMCTNRMVTPKAAFWRLLYKLIIVKSLNTIKCGSICEVWRIFFSMLSVIFNNKISRCNILPIKQLK